MATVTIQLAPEKEAALQAEAATHGLTMEQWVAHILEQHMLLVSEAPLQETNPQEWARRFHAWAESHDRTTPLLSDEAISRESIYPDRS